MARRLSKVFGSKAKEFPDLSLGFDSRCFQPDELYSYGIAGRVVAISYDQVQSLLAVATDVGVYVLGQPGVEVFFEVPEKRTAAYVILRGSHLVVIDTKSTLYTWTLEGKILEHVARQTLRGVVTSVYVDPAVDWLLIGLKDGTVDIWDLEGEQSVRNFRIKYQYRERQEEWRLMDEWYASRHISPVLGLAIHPLDLGLCLITYDIGVALYSFKDGSTKHYFEVTIPEDGAIPARRPIPTCATFSPDGAFVLVGYNDGTLAFFDTNDGESPLQVRTLGESNINVPRYAASGQSPLTYKPVSALAWSASLDLSETTLLIAGGFSQGLTGVCMMQFTAPTTKVNLGQYFAEPRAQRILPIEYEEDIQELCAIGTASPFHNHHDPRCLLIVTMTGRLTVMDLPTGALSSAAKLPAAISTSAPPVVVFSMAELPKYVLAELQKISKRSKTIEKTLLAGGASQRVKAAWSSQCLFTVHGTSIIRIYDISQGEILGPALAEIDTYDVLQGSPISSVGLAGAAGEFVVAAQSGAIVLYRFNAGLADSPLVDKMLDLTLVHSAHTPIKDAQGMLFIFDKSITTSPGFQPLCILHAKQGLATSVSLSEVGFLVVSYESGLLVIVDLRGPAVIFCAHCSSCKHEQKKSKKSADINASEYVTSTNIVTVALEGRLCLAVLGGTSLARVICIELMREAGGTYAALVNTSLSTTLSEPILGIQSCNSQGHDNTARASSLAALGNNTDQHDCTVLCSSSTIATFSGTDSLAKAALRGVHSTSQIVDIGGCKVIAVASKSGDLEIFSIPALRSLGYIRLPSGRSSEQVISSSGHFLVRNDLHEITLFNMFGSGKSYRSRPPDALFDVLKQPTIPRPTISNWAWITGTQYIRPSDLDLIITGGDRPLSKRAQERLLASEKQRELLERQAAASQKAKGYAARHAEREIGSREAFSSMRDSGVERGEKVSHVSDVMDNLEKASGEWLNEIDKLTKSAKKAAFRSFIGL